MPDAERGQDADGNELIDAHVPGRGRQRASQAHARQQEQRHPERQVDAEGVSAQHDGHAIDQPDYDGKESKTRQSRGAVKRAQTEEDLRGQFQQASAQSRGHGDPAEHPLHQISGVWHDIISRATAFGLEAASVDGQDVRAVYGTAKRLVDRARRGDGPAFLLCNTYRYHGHHVGDINREYYRSKQEEQTWKTERDPIANLGKWLVEQRLADADALARVQSDLEVEMKRAVDFAVAAPYPTVDEVGEDVYA